MDDEKKRLINGAHLIKDLIAGDEAVAQREEFSLMEGDEIRQVLDLLLNNPKFSDSDKLYLLSNMWRVHYRVKPPTIEEFLTEEWIGPTADSLYPHVQKILTDVWQPDSQYRHLLLGSAIGTGKSFTATISSLYVTTLLWAMRNPKKFFGLSQATSLVHMLVSFTQEKAQQLLLQPFMQILRSSKKFVRVNQEERITTRQKEIGNDQIAWTTAGKMGVLQFYNDIHYVVGSSPQKLLGLNLIGAILSELSFFMDMGFGADYIWRVYNDAKGRVKSRFGSRYLSYTIMDSSPNDIEKSPIDRYIFSGEADKDPENYVVTGSHWELMPFKYPDWQRTGEEFEVFRGSAGVAPAIIRHPEEKEKFSPEEIISVPAELKQNFEDNLLKNVKDYAGWPSGSDDKLIRNYDSIEEMFSFQLKNFYSWIQAPSDKNPRHLLWNMVKDDYFVRHGENNYEFYRAPREARFIHVDQSESNDQSCIACVHPEITKNGETVYITDFTLVIDAGKGRINLNAIRLFFEDLRDYGHLNIKLITFDQYQSSTTIQYLKNKGFKAERLSVDNTTNQYMVYLSMMQTGKLKAGRNVVLKNNIKSLKEVVAPRSGKKKIDHNKGPKTTDDGGNWNTSLMGTNAKDASDAHCGAVWNAVHNFSGTPRYIWQFDEEFQTQIKEKKNASNEDLKKAQVKSIKRKAFSKIAERYGFKEEDRELEVSS